MQHSDYVRSLTDLIQSTLLVTNESDQRDYLESRVRPAQVERVVQAFEKYEPYLPKHGRLFDFGCGMGADAYLSSLSRKNALAIFGGDVDDGKYAAVRAASNMQFKQLDPKINQLPYPNHHFSAVIASGVLEHVAMDNEMLKELHRILEPGGVLIVTFLPNLFSYTEHIAHLLKRGGHQRLYTRRGFNRQLIHHGFSVMDSGYHQLLPSAASGGSYGVQRKIADVLFRLNGSIDNVWPFRVLSSNVYSVARAVNGFY